MTAGAPHETAQALAGLARTLAAERDVQQTLLAVVDSAARTFHDVAAVGISYVDGARLVARAQSDELVTIVDDVQTALNEGPCLAAATGVCDVVRIDDLRSDSQFPRFAPLAVDHGILSVLSMRLFVEEATLGNLSLFAAKPAAFDETTETIGELYATHAALALHGVQLEAQLNHAIRTRDIIGQAKGVLMALHHLDEDTAFATLVRYSQSEHIKLHEVAERLIASIRTGDAATALAD